MNNPLTSEQMFDLWRFRTSYCRMRFFCKQNIPGMASIEADILRRRALHVEKAIYALSPEVRQRRVFKNLLVHTSRALTLAAKANPGESEPFQKNYFIN